MKSPVSWFVIGFVTLVGFNSLIAILPIPEQPSNDFPADRRPCRHGPRDRYLEALRRNPPGCAGRTSPTGPITSAIAPVCIALPLAIRIDTLWMVLGCRACLVDRFIDGHAAHI
jgi:hypothetical protein